MVKCSSGDIENRFYTGSKKILHFWLVGIDSCPAITSQILSPWSSLASCQSQLEEAVLAAVASKVTVAAAVHSSTPCYLTLSESGHTKAGGDQCTSFPVSSQPDRTFHDFKVSKSMVPPLWASKKSPTSEFLRNWTSEKLGQVSGKIPFSLFFWRRPSLF